MKKILFSGKSLYLTLIVTLNPLTIFATDDAKTPVKTKNVENPTKKIKAFNLFPANGEGKFVSIKSVPVQYFKVPYGKVCHKVDFFVYTGNALKTMPLQSLILRIYCKPHKLITTKIIKCKEIKTKDDWVSIDGIALPSGWYYIEFFTNSKGLRSQLRVRLFPKSKNKKGYAAEGWKGGKKINGNFKVRLNLGSAGTESSSLMGKDPKNIISNNLANYQIVLSETSSPAEETAAEVLRDTLFKMTDVELTITTEEEYKSGPMLAVGFNSKLPEKLKRNAFGELKKQELIIQSAPNVFLLAGGSPLGTLYAVYEYLFRQGVRWYTPKYTKIPKVTAIPIPKTQYRYSPPIIGRKESAGNHADNTWRSRIRLTCKTLWSPLGEKYGLPQQAEGPDMHTFWRLISKQMLKKNPNWLSEVDGKREEAIGTTWGLCLSNQDLRKYIIKRTIEYAKKHPEKNTIWVGQNDGSDFCTCKNCQAFYDAHGGEPSSLILQLVNELSDALEKVLPGRMVKTLAYSWTRPPPQNMKARDNVIIMFCAQGSLVQPIATDPERRKLRGYFSEWRKITKHMDVYLYFPCNDYWSPAPVNYVGAENIKWCAQNGFDHMYVAISGHGNSFGSESMNLRAWVYSRLMWDPTLDTQELMDDFISGYYGPAAEAVKQAVKWTHENIYDATGKFKKYENGDVIPFYVNPITVRQINHLFEKTYNSLPESDYKKHLSFAWIPYLWADFWLGFRKIGHYDSALSTWSVPMDDGPLRNQYARLIKKFMSEHRINALKELRKFTPSLLSIDKMGISHPASLLKDDNIEAVIVPAVGGKIYKFCDTKLNFAPLKEFYRGLSMEYPLHSTTEEAVNDRQITEYKLLEHNNNSIKLEKRRSDSTIRKATSLVDGVLTTDFTVTANVKHVFKVQNCIMFDLAKGVFGYHPTIYIEKHDDSWTKHVVGSETDFHWVEGTIDLSDSTGRIMLKRENKKEGILMTLHPEQLKELYFWYSRYEKPDFNPDYCGMLRFFINGKPTNLKPDQDLKLTWSLQILPNVSEILKEKKIIKK